jgi:hypothetical protein
VTNFCVLRSYCPKTSKSFISAFLFKVYIEKMLETLYFKCFFTKKFEIFGKNDFFTFPQKKVKILFWIFLTSNSERTSEIRWAGRIWTCQNLFFRFFSNKCYNSKKRILQLFSTTFYFSLSH